jgi:nitroimidazol reductase NimA-like FMN-containing flavoprotein (pyridoxamine 5'-phosphate oxidase superfamily)
MDSKKLSKVLNYLADGVETGYSSVITFAYKELLNAKEQQSLALFLRQAAEEIERTKDLKIQSIEDLSFLKR